MAVKTKQRMVLQYQGREADLSAVEANIRNQWKEAGNKISAIETLDIYVKPEEGMAYYVVNREIEGKVELF